MVTMVTRDELSMGCKRKKVSKKKNSCTKTQSSRSCKRRKNSMAPSNDNSTEDISSLDVNISKNDASKSDKNPENGFLPGSPTGTKGRLQRFSFTWGGYEDVHQNTENNKHTVKTTKSLKMSTGDSSRRVSGSHQEQCKSDGSSVTCNKNNCTPVSSKASHNEEKKVKKNNSRQYRKKSSIAKNNHLLTTTNIKEVESLNLEDAAGIYSDYSDEEIPQTHTWSSSENIHNKTLLSPHRKQNVLNNKTLSPHKQNVLNSSQSSNKTLLSPHNNSNKAPSPKSPHQKQKALNDSQLNNFNKAPSPKSPHQSTTHKLECITNKTGSTCTTNKSGSTTNKFGSTTNKSMSVTNKSSKGKRQKRSASNSTDFLFEDKSEIFNMKKMRSSKETDQVPSEHNSVSTSPKVLDAPVQSSSNNKSKRRTASCDKTIQCEKSTHPASSTRKHDKEKPNDTVPSKTVTQNNKLNSTLPQAKGKKNVKEKKAPVKVCMNSDRVKAKYSNNLGFATPQRSKKQSQDSIFRNPASMVTSTPVRKARNGRRRPYSKRLPNIFTNDASEQENSGIQQVQPSCTTDMASDNINTASFSANTCSSFDVNVDHDSCETSDSDSDSEHELPVYALSPSLQQNDIKPGHLVWVKWRNYTYWPAYIRNAYNRKGKPYKLSIQFLAYDWTKGKGFGIKYNPENILPFHCEQKAEIMAKGKEGEYRDKFKESLSIAEDYLNKKALGTIKGNDAKHFFMNDTICLNTSECEFIQQELIGDIKPKTVKMKKVDVITPPLSDDETISISKDIDKESKRIMARTKRSQKLIDFIALSQTKEYLRKIWNRRIPSEKHKLFFSTPVDRKRIRNPGFGPIYEEHQQEEVLAILRRYCDEITGSWPENLKIHYTIDVLVPEAVVFAISRILKCAKLKAWGVFHKGVKFTKDEIKKIHESLTDMSDVSPTDLARYEARSKNRMVSLGFSEEEIEMMIF